MLTIALFLFTMVCEALKFRLKCVYWLKMLLIQVYGCYSCFRLIDLSKPVWANFVYIGFHGGMLNAAKLIWFMICCFDYLFFLYIYLLFLWFFYVFCLLGNLARSRGFLKMKLVKKRESVPEWWVCVCIGEINEPKL